jgi:hypothetical protein
MKQFMDEVSFHNLGREGKETHLFKYLSNDNIEKLMTPAERQEIEKSKEEDPLPPGSVPCYIRRMEPDEAIEISKSAFSSYGYTYVYETIYYPDRVRDRTEKDAKGKSDTLFPVSDRTGRNDMLPAGSSQGHDRKDPETCRDFAGC